MGILRCSGWSDRKKRYRGILQKKEGFTLFEVVVTLGIIALLSGVLIGYGRTNRAQLVLVNTEVKVMNLFSRAKTLATSGYLEGKEEPIPDGNKLCGYGVHVDTSEQTAFIFRELAADCAAADNVYTDPSEKLEGAQYHVFFKEEKAAIITEVEGVRLENIIYIPPDPVIIVNNDRNLDGASITFETKESKKLRGTVFVSDVGQITVEQ